MKRLLTIGLILILCLGLCACNSSDSSESRKDKKTSSDSKDKDKKENKDNTDKDAKENTKDKDDAAGALDDLLGGLTGKKDSGSDVEATPTDAVQPVDEAGSSGKVTDQPDEGKKEKSDRNIVNKFYELVTVDGHTRDEFLNNEELADAYAMWDFYAYGTGVQVSLDYDSGYMQYTWYLVSTNAYSTAPIDNPNAVEYLLDYTMFLNAGDEPDWIPISVSYSDDTIIQTFTEGGGVCVYKLTE